MILCGGSYSGKLKSAEHDFKYLYWTISKMLSWNTFTCKGTYMTDWVGRSYINIHASYTIIHIYILQFVLTNCYFLFLNNVQDNTHLFTYIYIHIYTNTHTLFLNNFRVNIRQCVHVSWRYICIYRYGVATVSRIDKITDLFCRILSIL